MTRPHPSKLTLSQNDDGLELTHEEFAEADFQKPGNMNVSMGGLLS